jgi:hypothetical protein
MRIAFHSKKHDPSPSPLPKLGKMSIRDVDLAFDLVFYNIEAHIFYSSLSVKNYKKE